MKFEELVILLPCHSLEDFPVYYEGEQADDLLAAWSAMWHPTLLASTQGVPIWYRADVPPLALANRLVVIPQVSSDRLPTEFLARAKTEGATVIKKCKTRGAYLAAMLTELGAPEDAVDRELVADFLALGYCRLQVELLTRQMRYTSNIDEIHFREDAVAAANAAVEHDSETARQYLQQCFDLLNESRKYFYPVDSYLIDLTLVASTTLGAALREELAQPSPTNLLMAGETLTAMSVEEPTSMAALMEALDRGTVGLVGGEYSEREIPLLPIEATHAELVRGISEFERLIGRRPYVYGRRRFGLSPVLPQMLARLGYMGAVHVTLDDGRFPISAQCKTRWEGVDSSALDALVRVPRDAARPESFLNFSHKLGESMDHDHVATLVFAHWPGASSPWYSDLRRIARFTPVLGKFVTLDDYFQHTDMPGRLSKFAADEYRSPYLKQAIIRRQVDPISSIMRQHRDRAFDEAANAISTLYECLAGRTVGTPSSVIEPGTVAESADQPAATAADRLAVAVERFAEMLPRAKGSEAGCLVVNPCSFSRRIGLDVSQLEHSPAVAPPVVASGASSDRKRAVVDVPAMGFAWVGAGSPPAGRVKPPKPMAEGHTLRNEFCEVVLNRHTGGIQSIYDFRNRGNRLSQQLALRQPGAGGAPGEAWRDPDEDAVYSVMAADSIDVTCSGPVLGEIVSRGGLLNQEGRRLADYRQTVQLWHGSRVVLVDVELDPQEELRADPWNSYYAARFAWSDPDADLYRSVGGGRQATEVKRLEAPQFIEIATDRLRTTLLTGGLPYHRRVADNRLDSLLIVRGETARRFTFGIGIDLPNPAPAALELLAPACTIFPLAPAPSPASGWLFHMSTRNVVATHWEPLYGDSSNSASDGRQVVGFRLRLLETSGQPTNVNLRTFRPAAEARQTTFEGQVLIPLRVEDDRIAIEMAGHEWIQVEATW